MRILMLTLMPLLAACGAQNDAVSKCLPRAVHAEPAPYPIDIEPSLVLDDGYPGSPTESGIPLAKGEELVGIAAVSEVYPDSEWLLRAAQARFMFVRRVKSPHFVDLWAQRVEQSGRLFEQQQLMTNIDVNAFRFRTDGARVAVLNKMNDRGPTFRIDYNNPHYIREEWGSEEMKATILKEPTRGGPLGWAPEHWKMEAIENIYAACVEHQSN